MPLQTRTCCHCLRTGREMSVKRNRTSRRWRECVLLLYQGGDRVKGRGYPHGWSRHRPRRLCTQREIRTPVIVGDRRLLWFLVIHPCCLTSNTHAISLFCSISQAYRCHLLVFKVYGTQIRRAIPRRPAWFQIGDRAKYYISSSCANSSA